ncbi:MAG: hypothetical protein V7K48_04225 [Nostoc sp.]|uniref:hypothetical protein n=1 Tax=Nostoc sp. TaxID=1180 RepID=UPI002FF5AF12
MGFRFGILDYNSLPKAGLRNLQHYYLVQHFVNICSELNLVIPSNANASVDNAKASADNANAFADNANVSADNANASADNANASMTMPMHPPTMPMRLLTLKTNS